MSLSAALQERLLKRGIIKQQAAEKNQNANNNEEEEEVFAESYDDPNDASRRKSKDSQFELDMDKIVDCPNRNNPYHECSGFCAKKYGYKKFQPHPVMERRRKRMLKIYPLLPNWVEVPDLQSAFLGFRSDNNTKNRYYYWNTETNQVCWLSPSCPKTKFFTPKREEFKSDLSEQKTTNQEIPVKTKSADYRSSKSSSSFNAHKKQKTTTKNELDPMDPSSYSDCPRGKWSAGLSEAD